MISKAQFVNWANSLSKEDEHIAISQDGLFLEAIGRYGERTGKRLEIGRWDNASDAEVFAE